MKILGIETSCDETAAAVVESSSDKTHVVLLSQTLATSLSQHAKTGGIIPEMAARAQIQSIIPVIYDSLQQAGILWNKDISPDIDAIAITYGPGLIGSLLVGVETAKTLSYLWDKPLIPVNHLFGHIYANWVGLSSPLESKGDLPDFPAIALIVSGGHTDLVLMKSHKDITWLGGTRDDAAGEAFDKIGRLLGLAYPAGPMIEKLAKQGNPKAYHFPRPLVHDGAYDFSFSGLKTAVLREVQKMIDKKRFSQSVIPDQMDSRLRLRFADSFGKASGNDKVGGNDNIFSAQTTANISRGVQDAIIDVLVKKTLAAAEKFQVKSIILGGGVAANLTLRESFVQILNTLRLRSGRAKYKIQNTKFFVPQKSLCTDNAAMIGAAGFFQKEIIDWKNLSANPQLYFD